MPSLRKMPVPKKPEPKAGKPAEKGAKKPNAAALQRPVGRKEAGTAPSAPGKAGASLGAWEPPRVKWTPTKDHHAIVFDTETTGLLNASSMKAADQPRIIEFGAHRFNLATGEVVDTLQFLAHPGHEITAEITKITGITNDDLKDASPFMANFPKLQEFFLGAKTVLGQNVWFDLDMLMWELRRSNTERKFPWPPFQLDTIDLSYHIQGKRMRLIELYPYLFPGETYAAHRAMPDVNATLRCYMELTKRSQKGK